MTKTLIENKDYEELGPIEASKKYLLKRIKTLFPLLFFSTVFSIFLYQITYMWGIKEFIYRAAFGINDLLLLQNYGYLSYSYVGVIWFISALFFSMIVTAPIVKKYKMSYISYWSIFLSIIGYGIMWTHFKMLTFGSIEYLHDVLSNGTIRGFSAFNLGIFLYYFVQKINGLKINIFKKYLFTILEIASYIIIFVYFYKWKIEFVVGDQLIIWILFLATAISLSDISYTKNMFNSKLFLLAGKFSQVLFMNHMSYRYLIKELLLNNFDIEMETNELYIFAIFLSIMTSLIVMGLTNLIMKIFLKEKKV